MSSDMKKSMDNLMEGALTVPNLLSLIRIILVPVFLVLFLKKQYTAAIVVLIVSGLSDFFDGKIARKFNQISNLGKILDPIGDKLTEIAICIAYFFTFHAMDDELLSKFSWVFWFFVLKEVVMLLGGLLLLSKNITPSAAVMYGKVATFYFYVAMILLLLFSPEFGALHNVWTMPTPVIIVLTSISVVLTLIAFFAYAPDAVRQLSGKAPANNS